MERRSKCACISRPNAEDIVLHRLEIRFSANERVKNYDDFSAPRNGSVILGFSFLSQSPKSGSDLVERHSAAFLSASAFCLIRRQTLRDFFLLRSVSLLISQHNMVVK
jgi:hypothetical protein